MATLCRIIQSTLLAILLINIAQIAAAQQNRPQVPVSNSASRMRVVEVSPATTDERTPSYFTIIGEVKASGVFKSLDRSIPVGQLVQAAQGLTPKASNTIRIIRNREVRYQFQFTPEGAGAAEVVLPGDVVVVVPRQLAPSEKFTPPEEIPIACIGLLDIPVVLPLHPSIVAVEQLKKLLEQQAGPQLPVMLIQPIRGLNEGALVAGTVVVFDPKAVDRLPLRRPGALPEPTELPAERTSAFPGVRPMNFVAPPDVPGAEVIQRASADMIQPNPGTLQTADNTQRVMSEPSQNQLTLDLPIISDSNMESPRTTESPVVSQRPTTTDAMPVNLAQALNQFSEKPSEAPAPSTVTTIPPSYHHVTDSNANSAPAKQPLTTALSTSGSSVPPFSSERTSSPALVDNSGQSATPAKVPTNSGSDESSASTPSAKLRYLALAGLALCLFIAIGATIAMTLDMKSNKLILNEIAEGSKSVRPDSSQPPIDLLPPQVVVAPKRQNVVEQILDRKLPVVEELVAVPSQWPLHGKVIGHQRIILNQRHEQLAGPHFSSNQSDHPKRPLPTASLSEREIRERLKEVFRKANVGPHHDDMLDEVDTFEIESPSGVVQMNRQSHQPTESAARQPLTSEDVTSMVQKSPAPAVRQPVPSTERVQPLPAPSRNPSDDGFDIVQPQVSQTTPTQSPLERALRTLASEKNG
ncbi:hypothetical protein SH668x_001603 [Planctomicrobium sp. SH668]|uniref:hypothetical protein n=1 Tax=Planctomicrobium sp. SH668 TaxID=3448126 RepID=UPI003F5C9DAA